MARKQVDTFRARVSFPVEAWARIERLAERVGIDAPTLVRVMASLTLVQWEQVYLNPMQLVKSEQEIEGGLTRSAEGMFPELQEAESRS